MSIEKNFNKYLFNLVKSSAMDNKVAKTVALNYQRLNRDARDKFFESLMLTYSNFSDASFDNIKFEETSRLDSIEIPKDYRLKSVRLANVRGIPESKNGTKYGFDLFENGQIQNAVFLGPNGTGKSSLFNAIEFIYAHEVAEKKLRVRNPESLNENDFLKYLEHFNEAPECEIETPSGKFSLRNRVFKTEEELKTIYPDTHFISDYDIYRKGQLNYLGKNDDSESFHLLIASSLGLQDYLDFTNLLKSISTYRRTKESSERNKLINNRNNLIVENGKHQDQLNFKSKRIKELKSNNAANLNEDRSEKLAAIVAAIKDTSYSISFDKLQYQKIFYNYRKAQETFLGLSVNLNLQTEAQFLSLGLELINHSENCPFCENSKSSIPEIKRKIEKRILEIKEYEIASKNLEQSIRDIQNAIKDTLIIFQSTGRNLKIEVNRITAIPEFIEIHRSGKDLIDLLANETRSLIELDESISKIISSNDVLSKKDEAITKIINNKEVILLVDIANTPLAIKKFDQRRQQKIIEIENTLSSTQNTVTPKQQIIVLESEIKNHQTVINTNGQQIKNLEREIETLTKTIDTIAEIKQEAGDFAKLLDVEVNKLVASSFEPIKETIQTILYEYLKEENVELKIRLDEKPSRDNPESIVTTILAEIQRENTQTGELEIHSPSKYFNTFRFRLFCTMVNISVVIAARKNSGINLPLVLDDVFYASDYNSKTTFRQFILTILDIFRKFNSEMPLQLILFTHDELVFDSALDAIGEFEISKQKLPNEQIEDTQWKSPIEHRTAFARLFPAKDVEPFVTLSEFGNYWDLTYKIPTELEHLLNEH
jgi:energy-coupling factor transporter ATP-binding protein EcfA2